MKGERFDNLARASTVLSRSRFLQSSVAAVLGFAAIGRPARAQVTGICSPNGGWCTPVWPCCSGECSVSGWGWLGTCEVVAVPVAEPAEVPTAPRSIPRRYRSRSPFKGKQPGDYCGQMPELQAWVEAACACLGVEESTGCTNRGLGCVQFMQRCDPIRFYACIAEWDDFLDLPMC